MMAVGLNVVVGYAGLLDLGYVAFYAIGAYTAGWLASGQFEQVRFHFGSVGISRDAQGIHISVWLVLLCAGLITALGGILIGLPTLRLRGDYLAIVTLGFGEIIPQFVRNADSLHGFDLTHGTFGISPIDSPGFGVGLNNAVGLPVSLRAVVRSGAALLLGRARAAAHHRLLLLPPARLAARARVDRDSARTRRPRERWASRSCARRRGPTRSARSSAALRAPTSPASTPARSRASSTSTSRSSCSAW